MPVFLAVSVVSSLLRASLDGEGWLSSSSSLLVACLLVSDSSLGVGRMSSGSVLSLRQALYFSGRVRLRESYKHSYE